MENHRAAVALWIAFYNFCRVHETLRCTPAMALGVADHIWTIGELYFGGAGEIGRAATLATSKRPDLRRSDRLRRNSD